MKLIKYVYKTSKIKIFNSKAAVFIVILLAIAWEYNQPYLEFLREHKCSISWCIFPFYLASYGFLPIFYFGIIYINSDAPFMQHTNMYQIIRTGRQQWAIGQIGGIFVRSFVVTVLAAVAPVLPFLGKLELSNEWGKAVHTLASYDAYAKFATEGGLNFRFTYEILGKFTPLQLMCTSILLCTLICTFLGVGMFLISLLLGRIVAVSSAFACVLLLFFVENAQGKMQQFISHFTPTHWAEIALIATPDGSGYYRMPSLTYMFIFLLIGVVVMSLLICSRIRNTELVWENEDV